MQGITLNKIEIKEIMDHFDFNMDGSMNCVELTHELLDLPLPSHVRHGLPVPRRHFRPKLGPRTRQLMELLRQQSRRAAVSHKKLDHMFTVYDKDGSGSIAYDEIDSMVKEFHLEIEGADAAAMILDKFAPTGAMSYDDFCTKVIGLPSGSHKNKVLDPEVERLNPQNLRDQIATAIKKKVYCNPSAIKKAFVMFDKDAGGEISKIEFHDGFRSLKLPATSKQITQLFNDFDDQDEGYLRTPDFARISLEVDSEAEALAKPRNTPKAATPDRPRGALAMQIGANSGTLSRPASTAARRLLEPLKEVTSPARPSARLSRAATAAPNHVGPRPRTMSRPASVAV